MAERFEYYITGDNAFQSFREGIWLAQTFTPSVAHKILSVKLLLYRTGSPGTFTVSIKGTGVTGHPTVAVLCSGTSNGNTLTTNEDGEWREITLGAGYNLEADTKYAIVCKAPYGDSTNKVFWRYDNSGNYPGGNLELSQNYGDTWQDYDGYDLMFEEWGEPIPVVVSANMAAKMMDAGLL
ncbi:unnamed protein product [marine sediment metagenome]|uniref:DUF4082 domain-containing protein n=1 Tax=marine sediment metagenome TaxID=412755 RepID=X1U0W1_9ZZZZ